jgi:hypothetical protein
MFFDYWVIGVLFGLFVANTIFQFRLGFSQGSKGGYAVGMYHAVSWLMKNHALECENKTTGNPASAGDVVAVIIRSDTYNDFRLTDKSELAKIAEATSAVEDN